jgi:hypothetical protein
MVLAAAAVPALSAFGSRQRLLAPLAELPLPAAAYALASVGLAVLVLGARRREGNAAAATAVLALSAFLVLTLAGVVLDVRIRRSEDAAAAVRELKTNLPAGQPLVSLGGHTDSLFAYYYGQPIIAPRPWPVSNRTDADLTYFCFAWYGDPNVPPPQLPFAWEKIGAVSLDRNHHPIPERVLIVGRRLPSAAGE